MVAADWNLLMPRCRSAAVPRTTSNLTSSNSSSQGTTQASLVLPLLRSSF